MDKLETERKVCFCNNRIVEKPCLKCGGYYYLLIKDEKEYLLTKEIIDKVAEITNSSKSGSKKFKAHLYLSKNPPPRLTGII